MLRDKALDIQGKGWVWQPLTECLLSDAREWAAHDRAKDWQIWRARRVAGRCESLPIDIEPGELVVGKPEFRTATPAEQAQIAEANKTLESVPPFPGGDTGHFHPDYEKLFRVGVGGLLGEIARRRGGCACSDEQRTFYDACRIAMEGFQAYIRRVGAACDRMAVTDAEAAGHWRELAGICRRVAVDPPETFHEAAQLMFLTYVAAWFGEDHILTCYGRMDRTMGELYRRDVAAGRLTPQRALDIISSMYIQLNRTCPFGLALGVIVGGRDGEGRDVTCEVTYLALLARRVTKLVYPTVAISWHAGAPDELMDFAMGMIATGVGDPAMFNEDTVAGGLQDHGVSLADARNYMNSTCVEIKTAGNSNIWVATRYHNCCAALLEAMRREAAGGMPPAKDLPEFAGRVRAILAAEVRETAAWLDDVWRRREAHGCQPLASCLIADCLERGLDHDRGGTRYQWAENSFVGLANLVDSMVTIRELVFEQRKMTLAELYGVVRDNFAGHEPLRHRILNFLPKYGNDDDAADALAVEWSRFCMETTQSNTVGGHRYVPGFFCHINHATLGSQTGATPDGRLAGTAFADGAGAAQGRDAKGPTASVLSTTKWPHREALGGLVHNLRFGESTLAERTGRQAVRCVMETYLRRGGFEIQVNVVSASTLRAARETPETYRDLVVRVAGYSDYFTKLMPALQDELISRTEHQGA